MKTIGSFLWTFDGNAHVISNLQIGEDAHVGLFGQVHFGAWISNLGLEAVEVNGTGEYVGTLAGENNGRVTACHSSGMTIGYNSVGGLVGHNGGMRLSIRRNSLL